MHIHLPKPLHGWREFLGEVGIIMLGVLLALGAEQLLVTWHWREAVEREKIDLDREVSSNWDALDARRIVEPCVSRRLSELGRVIERHTSGAPIGLFGRIGRPAVWVVKRSGLDMATADGTLAHMSIEDRSAYFAVETGARAFERGAWEERDSWRVLNRLNHVATLSEDDWRDIRNAYENALDSDRSMQANLTAGDDSRWMWGFRYFNALPRNARALDYPQVQDLCRSVP